MISLISVYDHLPVAELMLYNLLKERSEDATINISHDKLPTFEEHQRFVRSNPYRCWFLIQAQNPAVFVGSLLLTNQNEIGVFLFKAHQNHGYAGAAVLEITRKFKPLESVPPGRFIANINPSNAASIKLFTKLGARHIQNTYQFD